MIIYKHIQVNYHQAFLLNSLRWKQCFRTPLTGRFHNKCVCGILEVMDWMCRDVASPQYLIASNTPSYFFFWAFSAALVTLPDEGSLKLTLCNKIQNRSVSAEEGMEKKADGEAVRLKGIGGHQKKFGVVHGESSLKKRK